MVRIGIVGSRRRNTHEDFGKINEAMLTLMEKLVGGAQLEYGDLFIISGGCNRGADWYANHLAEDLGIPIIIYYAEWKALGKKAGPIRNTLIAKESDILIACVADDRTGGTEDTIKKFKKYHPDGELIIV